MRAVQPKAIRGIALLVGALFVTQNATDAAPPEIDRPAVVTQPAVRQTLIEPPPATTTTTLPPVPPTYVIVGDSLCELANDDLIAEAAKAGISRLLAIDCEGGRPPAGGLPVALAFDPVPEVLMFELGTNPGEEGQSADAYDELIAQRPDTDIYLATGYREDPNGIQNGVDILNGYMMTLAETHSNVRVCDWAAEIRANTQWFIDFVHYNDDGDAAFGEFIISCMLGEFHD